MKICRSPIFTWKYKHSSDFHSLANLLENSLVVLAVSVSIFNPFIVDFVQQESITRFQVEFEDYPLTIDTSNRPVLCLDLQD